MGKASRNLQTTATALVEGTILVTPSEYLRQLLEPFYEMPSIGRMAMTVLRQLGQFSWGMLVAFHLCREN